MEHMLFECILGMGCSTFTILAADQKNTHGILVMKNDQNKLYEINKNIILGMNGDSGDVGQLTNYIEKNLALYKLKNGYDLDTEAMVHFTSRTLCDSLRTLTPFIISSLVGGYSKEKGGQLFYLDLLGSCVPLPFGAHGIAGLFTMGLMTNNYHRNLTREQAYEILRLCVREIQQRYSIHLGSFQVKVVDENGITELPVIKEECFF